MPQLFIDTAMILAAISGLPGLALPRNSHIAQWIAFFGMNISALLGLFGVGLTFFFSGDAVALPLLRQWYSVAGVDALSAFFLVPVFLMGGLGSPYGLVSDVFKRCSLWFHRFQHGFVQQYILYIIVILLLMLCFQFPIKEYIWQWFGH